MRLGLKFIVFCLVGFSSFLIDWFFFNIFYYIGIGFIFSRFSSAIISMIFNFNVNRNFTFSARGGPIKKHLYKWLILYGFAIFVNVAVGKLILISLGESLLNANIDYFCGVAIAIPISFLGSLLWVFKEKK